VFLSIFDFLLFVWYFELNLPKEIEREDSFYDIIKLVLPNNESNHSKTIIRTKTQESHIDISSYKLPLPTIIIKVKIKIKRGLPLF